MAATVTSVERIAGVPEEAARAVWEDAPGIPGFLTTVDHKRIGIRYIVTSFVFFAVAGLMALILRVQLAVPNSTLISPDTYNQLFTVHGTAMIFLFNTPVLAGFGNYLLPLMPEGSCIVNVATAGVLRSVPGTDAYLAAKGGVVSLSKAMAVSLAEQRIRVNVVCPGAVLTAEVASRAGDPRVEAMRSRLGEPLGRGLGQPEEVSSVIEFLCSPGAAYMNGAVIPIEGGSVA